MDRVITRSELVADGVVSKQEAARLLDVSTRKIEMMWASGELAWTRSGRLRKVPRAEITRYLEANLHSTTAVN